MIRHAFRSRDANLLWSAFQAYVKPKVMCASSAWAPLLKKDITAVESIQRRFSKWLPGFHELSYEERLATLGAMTLENSRKMLTCYCCSSVCISSVTLPYVNWAWRCLQTTSAVEKCVYFSTVPVATLSVHCSNFVPPRCGTIYLLVSLHLHR